MSLMTGKVHKYNDNISTDLIIASRHLTKFLTPEELGTHALGALDPDFHKKVKPGDFLVAGKNFGWGSSREEAVIALAACGLKAVIAESFSRTFFRNCINRGALLLVECKGISQLVNDKETLEIDFENGVVRNQETGNSLPISPVPKFIQDIISAGGLLKYIAQTEAM